MDDSLVDQFQLTLNIIVSLFVDRTIQLILKLNGFYSAKISYPNYVRMNQYSAFWQKGTMFMDNYPKGKVSSQYGNSYNRA